MDVEYRVCLLTIAGSANIELDTPTVVAKMGIGGFLVVLHILFSHIQASGWSTYYINTHSSYPIFKYT